MDFYTKIAGYQIPKPYRNGKYVEPTIDDARERIGFMFSFDLEARQSFEEIGAELGIDSEEARDLAHKALGKLVLNLKNSKFGQEMMQFRPQSRPAGRSSSTRRRSRGKAEAGAERQC